MSLAHDKTAIPVKGEPVLTIGPGNGLDEALFIAPDSKARDRRLRDALAPGELCQSACLVPFSCNPQRRAQRLSLRSCALPFDALDERKRTRPARYEQIKACCAPLVVVPVGQGEPIAKCAGAKPTGLVVLEPEVNPTIAKLLRQKRCSALRITRYPACSVGVRDACEREPLPGK